jgi:hypothetical protein
MTFLRARLALFAAIILALQLGIMPVAAMALCCDDHPQGAASHCDQPTCAEDDSAQACPMHPKTTAPATSQLTSCCDKHEQALAALLGVVGIAELAPSPSPAIADFPNVVNPAESLLAQTRPPDAPPPRA